VLYGKLAASMHTGGTTSWSDLGLPVDPLLRTSSSSQLPLPIGYQASVSVAGRTVALAVVVIEGILPVLVRLVEKIWRWEFVDLATCWYLKTQGMTPSYLLLTMRFMSTSPFHEHRESPQQLTT